MTSCWWRRVVADLRARRNLDAYAAAASAVAVGVASTVSDVLPDSLRWAVTLTTLGVLAVRAADSSQSTLWPAGFAPGDRAELSRESLTEQIRQAHEVWIFGLSAVNVLDSHNCQGLRDNLLSRTDGTLRIVVLDPDATDVVDLTNRQLNACVDFPLHGLKRSLDSTVALLEQIAAWPVAGEVAVHYLPFNPGFSMIAIDPRRRDGQVIVEFHGFHNRSTLDRMHLRFTPNRYPRWYAYWLEQYEHLWRISHL